MRRHLKLLGPVLLYAGLIVLLSSRSAPLGQLRLPPGTDKLVHFSEFALLGVLGARALAGYGVPVLKASLWALAACSAFGASDELHQRFTAGRDADVVDWVADVLGATVGIVLWRTVVRRSEPT